MTDKIDVFTIDGIQYGIILCPNGYIVTEDDFVHVTRPLHETFEERDVIYLIEHSKQMSISNFAHYWGIKDRVRENYGLLKKSVEALGDDPTQFPAWGA